MKKIKFLFLLLLTILGLTGCAISSTDATHKIVPPKNQKSPIKGSWKVMEIIEDLSEKEENNESQWLDKVFLFSEEYITLGDYFLENPSYQIKRVNGKDYLLYSHKAFLKNFSLPDGEVEVITVIDEDKFFCEMVWINEEELIVSIANYHFYLEKISDHINEDLYLSENKKKANKEPFQNHEEEEFLQSGVLIGLRDTKNHQFSYRTLWISAKNKQMEPILELNEIIFPRRSGFWKIETIRNTTEKRTEDFFFPYKILMEKDIAKKETLITFDDSNWVDKTGQVYKQIDYIGNDYIAIESFGSGKYNHGDEQWHENKLQILPVDRLPHEKNVKIMDLAGEEAVSSMKFQIQKTINTLDIKVSHLLDYEGLLDNFGLERKMGHWFFKGRINYRKENQILSADYNINTIPPSKLIFYDELSIPWTYIKDKVPEAIDAYTSPNKDLLLVVTKKEIIIYSIQKGMIQDLILQRIPLDKNETIIMAEWATGDYVENWTKTLTSLHHEQ